METANGCFGGCGFGLGCVKPYEDNEDDFGVGLRLRTVNLDGKLRAWGCRE